MGIMEKQRKMVDAINAAGWELNGGVTGYASYMLKRRGNIITGLSNVGHAYRVVCAIENLKAIEE